MVTWIEVLQGRFASILKAESGEKLLLAQQRLAENEKDLERFTILAISPDVAAEFDRLRQEKKYRKIGRADLLIAAIVLVGKATLVTRNVKHFRQVPNLQIEKSTGWIDCVERMTSMTTNRFDDPSRRGVLRSMIGGSILLPGVVSQLLAEEAARSNLSDPLAPKPTHFPPKAKRAIFLYMSGGVSHVDSWDPKPKLFADAGKTVPVNEFQGRKGDYKMYLTPPRWKFSRHGKSGTEVSRAFPKNGRVRR